MPQTDLRKARARAAKLGVSVRPSTVKNKKLAVYKDGHKLVDIGDRRYSDFLQHGDEERRRRYKTRHESKYPIRHAYGLPNPSPY